MEHLYIISFTSPTPTSQRNINSTFELDDGLKPIYATIIVVLSRRTVSDILFFLAFSKYGHRLARSAHASAVSYTPHPARVSVYLVPQLVDMVDFHTRYVVNSFQKHRNTLTSRIHNEH